MPIYVHACSPGMRERLRCIFPESSVLFRGELTQEVRQDSLDIRPTARIVALAIVAPRHCFQGEGVPTELIFPFLLAPVIDRRDSLQCFTGNRKLVQGPSSF